MSTPTSRVKELREIIEQHNYNYYILDAPSISDGEYAKLLYDKFGYERVEKELDEFLSYDFFPRFGGGIGITRLMSALDKCGVAK